MAEIELPRSRSQMLNTTAPGNSAGNNIPSSTSTERQHSLSSNSPISGRCSPPFEKEKDFEGLGYGHIDGNERLPVEYHYLTFETELPQPASVIPESTECALPPAPPDLRKYGSPFSWPARRKNPTLALSCVGTALTAYTAGSYSPGTGQMMAEWGFGRVAILLGITTFCLGFGIAPMVLAPFSEINGRRPVFIASGFVYIVCQLACALTPTYSGMLIARFIVGCGCSTFSTMVGGVISDIYHTADRNTPMTLFSGSVLVGTGLGPFISGFIAQHTTWRWMFYLQVIVDGVLVILVAFFFEETRGSVLLSRKAKILNKWYEEREAAGYYGFDMPSDKSTGDFSVQRIRWKVKSDEERASLKTMIAISCYRPFHLLFTEPVVFFFSLWVAFSWAILYLTFAAVPLIFTSRYGFDLEQDGLVFLSVILASIVFTPICIYQDIFAKKHNKLSDSPEARLYFTRYQSILLPIGLFMFGWTSTSSIHWIVPAIAIALSLMGIFSIYLAVFNYLADTYHRYASSALAAQSLCRNLLGGVFPLVTNQLFTNLGYGAAGSLLGAVGLLLTAVPWILFCYGPKIRRRSRFASEIMDTTS